MVGRLQDDNCDGTIDARDTPNVVFVSGDAHRSLCGGAGSPDSCRTGVLRALDGASGEEVWSLERPAPDSVGFAGMSVALGDVMGDEAMEIVTLSGEGRLVIVSHQGTVLATNDEVHPLATQSLFGWGGIALADIEGDGDVEAAFGATVWSIAPDGTITRRFREARASARTGSGRPPPSATSRSSTSTARSSSSFTATEASIVADVDGDGHADMVMISNGAGAGYECDVAPWNTADGARVAWTPPSYGTAYRGITVWRDRARSWVGTRAIWNQHSDHVTNVCASSDSACPAGSHGGQIPARPLSPWSVEWLNSFRQNIAEEGIFAAPDAVVSLRIECTSTPRLVATLRNVGAGRLAAGVVVRFEHGEDETVIGTVTSPTALSPGQAVERPFALPAALEATDAFRAVIQPDGRTSQECDSDNDRSELVRGSCLI